MQKKHSTINLFIRSLIFSIFFVVTVPLYTIPVLFTVVLPIKWRHTFIRGYIYVVLYVLKKVCLIDYRVEGLENIPKDNKGVVMVKHQSTWETFYMGILFPGLAVLVKRELMWIPFFGWALWVAEPISINRSDKKSAMKQLLDKGIKFINEKRWVLLYPEGTRVPSGMVGQYRMGGARLACAAGVPVIPVAHNAGRCWPRRKFIKQPGMITVVVGPPIQTEGRTPEEVLELTKNWIETTMLRIDGLVHEPTRQ